MNQNSNKDISSMTNYLKLFEQYESVLGQDPQQATGQTLPTTHPTLSTCASGRSSGDPSVDAMKNILEKFNSVANQTAESLAESVNHSSDVREAIQTKKLEHGVQIGNWQVVTRLMEGQTNKKVFEVSHATNNQILYSDLAVYEAALAVVKYLNTGMTLSDPKIRTVLDLEETFNRNRIDAARFKQRYKRCQELKEHEAADVFAARYQVARANALVAQDQLKSLLETIRL